MQPNGATKLNKEGEKRKKKKKSEQYEGMPGGDEVEKKEITKRESYRSS